MLSTLVLRAAAWMMALAVLVIQPNQEALLSELLGRGVDVAGCRWDGAQIDHTFVRARYLCGADHHVVSVTLRHPSVSNAEARSAQFAFEVPSGSPDAATLAHALASRFRSNDESRFVWTAVSSPGRPRFARFAWIGGGLFAALVALGALLFFLRRRRRAV